MSQVERKALNIERRSVSGKKRRKYKTRNAHRIKKKLVFCSCFFLSFSECFSFSKHVLEGHLRIYLKSPTFRYQGKEGSSSYRSTWVDSQKISFV